MSPRTRCQPGPEAVLGAALADGSSLLQEEK